MAQQTLYPARRSFAAGQISELLHARSDTRGYQEGCDTLKNMVTDSRGPLIRRPGFEFVAEIDTSQGTNTNMFPFTYKGQSWVVVIKYSSVSTSYTGVEVYDSSGVSWAVEYDVKLGGYDVHLWSNSDVPEIRGIQTSDEKTLRLVQNNRPPVDLTYNPNPGSSQIYFTLTAAPIISAPEYWVGDLAHQEDNDYPSTIEMHQGRMYYAGTSKEPTTLWGSDVYTTETNIQTNVSGGSAFTIESAVISDQAGVVDGAVVTVGGVVQYGWTPFLDKAVEDEAFNNQHVGRAFPEKWGVQLSSAVAAGEVVKISTPSVAHNCLYQGDGTIDDQALEATIAAKGAIRWMESTKNLLIGTEFGEHILSAANGIITPTDHSVQQQSAYGSSQHQPARIGSEVVYTHLDKQKLSGMRFQWTDDGWLSKDITFFAEGIPYPGIASTVFAQHPRNILWAQRTDGTLMGATVNPDGISENIGWHTHETEGTLKSMTVVDDGGNSVLWVTVDRGTPGSVLLERLTFQAGEPYMDSYTKATFSPESNTVTGLERLEGKTVQGVIDGAVVPSVVVTGGEAVFEYAGSTIAVGLPCPCFVKTLPLDVEGPTATTRQNSILSWKKRFIEIVVRVLNSAMPKINGERPPDRSPSTNYNTPQPPVSGDVKVMNLGFGGDGSIEIEQDLPLPLTIVGVFGKAEVAHL